MSDQEVIVHACVISPTGLYFFGKCHADCFGQAYGIGIKMSSEAGKQGFVTNKGRFLSRADAAKVAFEAGQIDQMVGTLFSEDLWSETDGGKFSYDSVEGYILR